MKSFQSFLSGYNIHEDWSDFRSKQYYHIGIYGPYIMIHVHNNATDIITTHPHRSHSVVASCWPHCQKYKMNSEEQNEIQNRLHSWHKKKNIKCPSCKSPLITLWRKALLLLCTHCKGNCGTPSFTMHFFYWKLWKSAFLLLVLRESKFPYVWETAR